MDGHVRMNTCSPRRQRWEEANWARADWPGLPSLCPAWVRSPDLGVKQVLVSALALPFRSLESSRHFTSIMSNYVVIGLMVWIH